MQTIRSARFCHNVTTKQIRCFIRRLPFNIFFFACSPHIYFSFVTSVIPCSVCAFVIIIDIIFFTTSINIIISPSPTTITTTITMIRSLQAACGISADGLPSYPALHAIFSLASTLGDEAFYTVALPLCAWLLDLALSRRLALFWASTYYVGQAAKVTMHGTEALQLHERARGVGGGGRTEERKRDRTHAFHAIVVKPSTTRTRVDEVERCPMANRSFLRRQFWLNNILPNLFTPTLACSNPFLFLRTYVIF